MAAAAAAAPDAHLRSAAALRSLKRRVSDASYARLQNDVRRARTLTAREGN